MHVYRAIVHVYIYCLNSSHKALYTIDFALVKTDFVFYLKVLWLSLQQWPESKDQPFVAYKEFIEVKGSHLYTSFMLIISIVKNGLR